ncbi:MAG: helicase-associated domain-containing protein [Planctomycetota bacterium]|nr:helicase-associated domain-containing protein [Planctomycetota bacterium]
MRAHEVNWSEIEEGVALLARLPREASRALLGLRESAALSAEVLGAGAAEFVHAGLLVRSGNGEKLRRTIAARPLFVFARAAGRCDVLRDGDARTVRRYVQSELEVAERGSILFTEVLPYGDVASRLAAHVSEGSWHTTLLDPQSLAAIQRAHRDHDLPGLGMSAAVHESLQRWLAVAMKHDGPLPARDLVALVRPATTAHVDVVLRAALRFLLVFPTLDEGSGQILLGPHPRARTWAESGSKDALQVEPPETLPQELPAVPAHLPADVAEVLLLGGATHVRVRADHHLYQKDAAALAAALGRIHVPSVPFAPSDPDDRLGAAIRLAQAARFIGVARDGGSGRRMVVREAGRTWLALGPSERFDALLAVAGPRVSFAERYGRRLRGYDPHEGADAWDTVLAPCDPYLAFGADLAPLQDAVLGVLRRLPTQGAVRVEALLEYAARAENPLLNAMDLAPPHHRVHLNPAALRHAWRATMARALGAHLFRWGGLRVGWVAKGGGAASSEEELAVGLTELGAYVLGLIQTLPVHDDKHARIVVQPTFDVVFMDPAPAAEAELSVFCERTGAHVGAVFKITRTSIQRAAASGVARETILEALERVATGALPENVRREIEGWHARHAVLALERPYILRCGDRETADRVMAISRGSMERIGDAILLLAPGTRPAALAKLLEKHGFTLDAAGVQPPPGRRRRGRRS